MTDSAASQEEAVRRQKVVIRKQDGTLIRGYYCSDAPADLSLIAGSSQSQFHKMQGTCVSEAGTPLEVDWSQVKAVFFVATFEGDRDFEAVRFFTSGQVQTIWVEIVFTDGEIIEGCIRNSLHHLKYDGFFLRPSTPGSNNLLIYVNKAAIVSFRVLGVRTQEDQ
jgi:hypothetical protein